MDRPLQSLSIHSQISLTFMPTPLEVAESSIVALIIFSVFCYHQYCSSSKSSRNSPSRSNAAIPSRAGRNFDLIATSSGANLRGRVRRHALHVLPLILQTESEPSVGSLWVVAGHQGQRLHCGNPHGYHAAKPVYFACIAPDEATQVYLPARVLDVQVICLECLSSDRLVFRLADVPGLPRVREVAVPGPITQQETKTRRIVHGFAGCSSVIRVSGG